MGQLTTAGSSLIRLLPGAHRPLFADRRFCRLLPVFTLSDLGEGMSTVAVAWLALALAPASAPGVLVGAAVAAYILPGVLGALALGRWMRRLPARQLLVVDGWLRAVLLGAVPVAWAAGALTPVLYVSLLAGSSLLHAWGKAGKYALFAPLLPDDQRLAANTVLSTSVWTSVIVGPAPAGVLADAVSPALIIGLDALTFAVLALQAGAVPLPPSSFSSSASRHAAGGSTRQGIGILLRQRELLGLLAVTWFFNLFFGPVEVALPLFVTHDLHAGSGLLGCYWAAFGAGGVLGAFGLDLARRLLLWPVMLGIIAGHGLALLPFALHTNAAAASLAGFAAAGIVYGPYSALSFTLVQDRTPADSLTTVLAAAAAAVLVLHARRRRPAGSMGP
ncbi:MFS family permease [Kitasatospora sp. MAP12-15]|uniref:MFS transporter n=1 Tax=unclassified Kitasatospora TaxID=2633591 RepID=UPI0024730E7C|nr:MFS transporter [Kitasatospora sp. MAP12-44]MDH6109047.1 MFS family permease [Kitasatospora sp. MAP12-44]